MSTTRRTAIHAGWIIAHRAHVGVGRRVQRDAVAAAGSKIVERGTHATTAAHVFDAATLGGATALGRDDLGRIARQAAADRMWPRILQHDWAGRDVDGLSPPTYPEWR